MMPAVRIALMSIKLVTRTKVALFFTFLFPLIFLFVYAGLFARGRPDAVVYMFGPVVTLNIMGSGFWGLGLQSVMQRERGSLRRYRVTPVGAGSMVLASLLANYLLELPTIALLLVCAMTFFHMPLNISLPTLLILVSIGTFAFAGFGLTIASVANSMQEAQVFNNVAWLALLFLSGVTVPLPLLPNWIQHLAAFLPATYLVTTIQGIMIRGDRLLDHGAELLVLLLSGTFGFLFAWKLFRWDKEEKISTRNKLVALTFVVPFVVMGLWMNERGNLRARWNQTFSLVSSRPIAEAQHDTTSEGILVADFERSEEPEALLKTWRITTEAPRAGGSLGELEVTSPGADGTAHALRFRGRLQYAPGLEQGSVTAHYAFTLPPALPEMRGITLEIRGDRRPLQIKLRPPDPSLPAPTLTLIPDSEWQTVRLPSAWPEAASATARRQPYTLELRAEGPAGDFQFDVDEIRVY